MEAAEAMQGVPASWADALAPVLDGPESQRLAGWLAAEARAGKTIYPPAGQWLRALEPVSYTHLTLPTSDLV